MRGTHSRLLLIGCIGTPTLNDKDYVDACTEYGVYTLNLNGNKARVQNV